MLGQCSSGEESLRCCRLIDFYWERLSAALVDLGFDKLRRYPQVAARIYPGLRRAAMEVYESIQVCLRTVLY